jgi:glycosyltransferase involved in cell wall biosynthesis
VRELYLENIALFRKPVIHIVHHGVAVDTREQPVSNDVGSRPAQFLFVGRLVEQKGILLLLEVAEQLCHEDDIRIIVRGEGPLAEAVAEAAERLPEGRLLFEGFQDVPFHDAHAIDALLFPSIALEGLPYSILEAFAHGVPVISHALPVLRDLVVNKENGLIVQEKTAAFWIETLRHAATHRQMLVEMGESGRERVEREHRPDEMFRNTARIYESLLDRKQ